MSKALKIILIILAVLLVLTGAAAIFVNQKLNRITFDEDHAEPAAATPSSAVSTEAPLADDEERDDSGSKIINLLLVGSDKRIPNTDDIGRGDCEILCHMDSRRGVVRLVSIERAVGVPVQSKNGGYDLITHAYRYDGGAVLSQTVSEMFDVELEGYVNVDYEAFEKIVDAIGGVDIELTDLEAWALNRGRYNKPSLIGGLNHLDGSDALAYCRLRSIDSDFGRVERQRKTIAACMKQVKTLSLSEMNDALNAVLPFVNTNLTKTQLAGMILKAPKFLKNIDVEGMTIPEKNDYTYINRWDGIGPCWKIDLDKYNAIIKAFFNS